MTITDCDIGRHKVSEVVKRLDRGNITHDFVIDATWEFMEYTIFFCVYSNIR